MILIGLLILRNIKFRNLCSSEKKRDSTYDALTFESKLKGDFHFNHFPIELNKEGFHFWDDSDLIRPKGFIIMVFDLTVCGSCLHDQLDILKSVDEKAVIRSTYFLAIVGVASSTEKSEIINLHRTGELFFPFKTIGVESLYKMFKLSRESFIDTPFYFYIDDSCKILDVCKPEYLQTARFIEWLNIVLDRT